MNCHGQVDVIGLGIGLVNFVGAGVESKTYCLKLEIECE